MPSLKSILYYGVHIGELRSMVQWKLWHDPVHQRDEAKESADLKRCFKYLDMTSRSFAAVIKELHPELLVPVCLFYLILRGLDTIEDDMTIPIEKKEPELRAFHENIYKEGWNYKENGPNEKDRELCVNFDCVVAEFLKIKEPYQVIIADITKRMGNGMADYAMKTVDTQFRVNTIDEYYQYCHYVAGLVGEGLTRLFVEAGLADAMLLERADLHESMGQFLQQTNIIRDIREDHDDRRYFWPTEVWSQYVDKFDDLFEPQNREKALECSSHMVLLALKRAEDCLHYLRGIGEQSVFNFCAIPQSMAIATLELCFQNPTIFDKNVKITKGTACSLMTESTQNRQVLYSVFKRYARIIHKRNNPKDKNFLAISIACANIEKYIESVFPTQSAKSYKLGQSANSSSSAVAQQQPLLSPEEVEAKKKADAEAKEDMFYIMLAVGATLVFVTFCMFFLAWLFGARFDIAWEQIRSGKIWAPDSPEAAQSAVSAYDAAKSAITSTVQTVGGKVSSAVEHAEL